MDSYTEIKRQLACGWNTWNNRSVLSHVLLPEGFAINLCLKEYSGRAYLKEALIGKVGQDEERIHPGAHAYDGSYTELNIKWRGIVIVVQSAVENGELVLLVTPIKNQKVPATLVVEAGILWNEKGSIISKGNIIIGRFTTKEISLYTTKTSIYDPYINTQTPYIAMTLNCPIGISTNKERSLEEIKMIIEQHKTIDSRRKEKYGEFAEVYNAMQSCMAWDTIYEPKNKRVLTTVSRNWNNSWGGYVLFCWDTYFGAYMASVDNKELAYSNAIEMTREKTEKGFVPNFSAAGGCKSRNRSEPPVGSLVVRELYRKYNEKWFLQEVFEGLYSWNNWFMENRSVGNGLLAWGSDPYVPIFDNYWESEGVNKNYGAALESGLDNSPMYDEVPFDENNHCIKLADIGLVAMYIMDCSALYDIAVILEKKQEAKELKKRIEKCTEGLKLLWDEKRGIFANKRIDTGEFSSRISPTSFYALFSEEVTKEQADRMLSEHFYNEDEFWGEWIIPSISRNDPAYKDQNYWRGRIWAPMNFLVYLAFKKHNLKDACRDIAEKSKKLLLNEWLKCGHVHENYCGDTGEGCNKHNSDKFYHWGALLSLIVLMEGGFIEGPEKVLKGLK